MVNRLEEKNFWLGKSPSIYRSGIGLYARNKDAQIIAKFLVEKRGTAIDIPCGEGRHSLLLKSLGFSVLSADISETMLKTTETLAGTETSHIDVFNPGDIRKFKGRFDVVLSSRLFFHYYDQDELFRNLVSLMKSGGVIIFDTLNKNSIRWFIHRAILMFGKFLLSESQYNHERSLTFNTPQDVLNLATEFNLKLVEKHGEYLLPTRLYRFIPSFLTFLLCSVERAMPDKIKTLTYWKFTNRI